MIQKVFLKDKLLSIIIKSNLKKDGIEFFTPNEFSQQLAYMNRPNGYVILPHVHNTVTRKVLFTQEVLFIKSGKVRIDFYSDDKTYIESKVLRIK